MRLFEWLCYFVGFQALAPGEHVFRRCIQWVPQRDGCLNGQMDRTTPGVNEPLLTPIGDDWMVAVLELPDEPAADHASHKMIDQLLVPGLQGELSFS